MGFLLGTTVTYKCGHEVGTPTFDSASSAAVQSGIACDKYWARRRNPTKGDSMMKTLTRSLVAIVVAAGIVSCRKKSSEANAPAPVLPGKPIMIGALFAVTGPASFLGGPEKRTAEMIVDAINAKGGVNGRIVQLLVKDTGASPEKCISFTRQLIDENKVCAIIGPSTSGETMSIKSICEKAKVPLVSCAAAEVIVKPVAKYVFKTPQKDSQAVTWIFRTMKSMNISKIGIVSGNTGFGKAGKKQLETMAPGMGIEVVASEVYDKKATDLTDVLAKLKAANVQAVVNWSIVPAQAIVAKNMKQIGLDVPLFQSHGFGNIKYVQQAGGAAEGTIFPGGRLLVAGVLPAGQAQKKVLEAYKMAYEDRFKEPVSTFGGHAYDALHLVIDAIKKTGSDDRDKIRDALEATKNFVGTGGVFNFSPEDHNGLTLDAFEMLTVKNGQFVLYRP